MTKNKNYVHIYALYSQKMKFYAEWVWKIEIYTTYVNRIRTLFKTNLDRLNWAKSSQIRI